jgi:hypothetical protein
MKTFNQFLEEATFVVVENMSEEELDSILESSAARRRETREKLISSGSKKRAHPHGPTQTLTTKSIRKNPETGKPEVKTFSKTAKHPRTQLSKVARGLTGGSEYSEPNPGAHSTAKVAQWDRSAPGGVSAKTIKGYARGVKKTPGAKVPHPQTETQKRIQRRKEGKPINPKISFGSEYWR